MRKYFISIFVVTTLIFLLIDNYGDVRDFLWTQKKDNIIYNFRVDNKYFSIYKFGKWYKTFITGVNIGAAKPGYFPGEHGISKEDYLRWFDYIDKLNVNSIRVYTLLKPEFYEALYEHNKKSLKPLYIFHGVWIDEEQISKFENAYAPEIKDGFLQDIKQLIDVIHGNAEVSSEKGHASGTYTYDISNYVVGWILGIEWDPSFVIGTNEKNKEKVNYDGVFLYSENAGPFEVFLSEIGDTTIAYETEKYSSQRPLSFTNWVTTDMLEHPNEPLEKEDLVAVNVECIKAKENFKPGLFASYHIYPYYPDFMNYEEKYKTFKDQDGRINTYKAYLRDLRKEHNIPVLVAEYGIPSSRGMAHRNIHMNYNQGNHTEEEQGRINNSLLKDILEEDYAGGLVFTWQDEWFKRTWNTMDYDIPERRPYWSNVQTNEQMFGVLDFEPGKEKSICYVDGDMSEWLSNDNSDIEENKIYIKHDERYVYFLVKSQLLREDNIVYIPLDTIPNQGNSKSDMEGISFKSSMDFLIKIDSKKEARIFIDIYYDSFAYQYGKVLNLIEYNSKFSSINSGVFSPIYLALNRSLYLPIDKINLPFEKYEAGILVKGVGNPDSSGFSSLTDYSVKEDVLELRIPWALLNFMDPSTKTVMDDLQKHGIKPRQIEGFGSSLIIKRNLNKIIDTDMVFYTWQNWEEPFYHERLKKSYFIMQEYFKTIQKTFEYKLGEEK